MKLKDFIETLVLKRFFVVDLRACVSMVSRNGGSSAQLRHSTNQSGWIDSREATR